MCTCMRMCSEAESRGSALRNSLARRLSTSAYDPHALLHSSRIPTSHFQDSLPKLGVPIKEIGAKILRVLAKKDGRARRSDER